MSQPLRPVRMSTRNRTRSLIVTFSLILSIFPSLLLHSSASSSSAVVELNDGNFDAELDGQEVVVNFFAPWCGQCTSFKPIYEGWAAELAQSDSGIRNILVAKVDCTLNPGVADARRIQAFPTVQFFRDGKMISEFHGERSSAALFEWVQLQSKQTSLAAGGGGKSTHADRRGGIGGNQAGATGGGASAGKSGGKTAFNFQVQFPDFSQLDLTDPSQLRQLLLDLLDMPKVIFDGHPYMCMGCLWMIGLFQGLFFGIIWTSQR